jgi:hypothetical protein
MASRSAVRRYQRMNIPSLFLKLDIVKAFDSVRWEYLISLLQQLGFPSRWRDWIAAILSTSTSRVFVNGVPNPPLSHGRGLRQGDPLSPLLFVLAIDPLQKVLDLATETELRAKSGAARLAFVSHCMLMMRPCLLHQKKRRSRQY